MNRNHSVDLVKAIAVICVVIIHISSYTAPILSFDWTSAVLWGSISRAAVPLFFMCSGVLFLAPERELSVKKLFGKYLARIVVAMLFWAILYHIYHLVHDGAFSLATLWMAIKQTLVFKQEFHFYYLHIVLLVYILLPILRIFTRHATQRELLYALAVWFVLGILYPTVRTVHPISLLHGIPAQWMLNMTYSAIGYLLAGYYLSRYPIPRATALLSLVSGFVIMFVGTVLASARANALITTFFEGMRVGAAAYAIGIFALCSYYKKPNPAFRKLSEASFCIYLTHMFFIYILRKFLPSLLAAAPIWSIPAASAIVLCTSFALYLILSKIPVVSKWLI